jgi:CHAT domain-containing protein/tetratricopeptide (TPR) repeat protein
MQFTCPDTNKQFPFEVWLIVDTAERPDLLEKMRDETLHLITSPFTGNHIDEVNAPLLVFQPNKQPPLSLFYSPVSDMSREQNHDIARKLAQKLEKSVGDLWQNSWVSLGLQFIERNRVPFVLSENPKAYLLEMAERLESGVEQVEDPIMFLQEKTEIDLELLNIHFYEVQDELPDAKRIELWRNVLDLMARLHHPLAWATIKTDIANTLGKDDSNGENIESAINHYEQVLEVYRRDFFPEKWAEIQHNLGNMYYRRTRGDWHENFGLTLKYYQSALEVRDKELYPAPWARTQFALGGAYLHAWSDSKESRIAGAVEYAIAHFEQALQVIHDKTYFMWGEAHKGLAQCYIHRSLDTKAPKASRSEDVERGIHHYIEALEYFIAPKFPEKSAYIRLHLALAYMSRTQGQKRENLESALQHCYLCLKALSIEHHGELWAKVQFVLARVFYERIEGLKSANLENGICHAQLALRTFMHDQPQEYGIHDTHDFLTVLYSRRRLGREYRNRELAIHHGRKAVEGFSKEQYPKEWANACNNLAGAYAKRIRGNRKDNLETALLYYDLALTVFDRNSFPENWAMVHDNLVSTYRDRINGEKHQNLEQALYHGSLALQVRTKEDYPEEWAHTMHAIGVAYSDRMIGNRSDNFEQAILHFNSALEVFKRNEYPDEWSEITHNLAAVYTNRIKDDHADNFEIALELGLAASEQRTLLKMPKVWADSQRMLGTTYRDRIKGSRSRNLELALYHYAQALKVYTLEHFPEQWAETTHYLATVHYLRSKEIGLEEIDSAIDLFNAALQVRTFENYPEEFAMTQNNLANCYSFQSDRDENLEKAIFHYSEALKVRNSKNFPERWAEIQNNLGGVFAARLNGDRAFYIQQAIYHYEEALTVYTRWQFPIWNRNVHMNLAGLYFSESRWAESYQSCIQAMAVGSDLLDMAYSDTGRKEAIGGTGLSYIRASYCALQLGKHGEAFIHLEAGKARLLAEAQSLGDANLMQLDDDEREQLGKLRDKIKSLEYEARLPTDHPARRDERAIMDDLRKARSALRALIDEFRAKYLDFMPDGLAPAELLANIPADGALVAPLFTSQGSAVFIMPGGVREVAAEHVLLLDDFKLADLNAITRFKDDKPGWLRYYIDYHFNGAGEKSLFDGIDDVTRRLWDAFVGRVHEKLGKLGVQRVLFMPQGDTNLLPLHAAWRAVDGARRYFMDDYAITYTPSMSALATAKRKSAQGEGALVAAVSQYPTMNDLPNTRAEAESIAALLGTAALLDGAATVEAVKNGATGKAYVHLSCHGGFGWGGNAFASALYLWNEEALPLSDIMANMKLEAARLVVLSACETGIVDFQDVPDEFVGLPAGFMQVGAQAVVSSLWTVEDRSTALLMERMYNNLRGDNPLEPAAALREAQFWLRDATAAEIGAYYQQYLVPRMSQSEAGAAFVAIMRRAAPHERPYAHPYYWAAFTYNGL